jgi:hypothetical protein
MAVCGISFLMGFEEGSLQRPQCMLATRFWSRFGSEVHKDRCGKVSASLGYWTPLVMSCPRGPLQVTLKEHKFKKRNGRYSFDELTSSKNRKYLTSLTTPIG